MEIKKLINIEKKDIEIKKHNIFIGLCIGNKFFSKENIKRYLLWALKNTKEKILILIVDEIQLINLNVRNNSSESHNLRYLAKQANLIKNNTLEIISDLNFNEQKKIKIINWNEYQNLDKLSLKTTVIVYKEFKNNNDFANSIINSIKNSINDRIFSQEKYFKLADYVLDEFSVAYSGIVFDKITYSLIIYPITNSVLNLIYDIKNNKKFQKLNEKLPINNNGVCILT